MTLDDCYNQHQGTAVSFDGLAEDKGQCLQWASVVNRDVYGKPAFFTPAAKDWWYNFHGAPLEPFYDQIPRGAPIKKGDFIIYDPLSSTDPQGHIDVASRDGVVQNFWAYDSNWDAAHFHDANGNPTLHEVSHADGFNSKVIGYLRLKGNNNDMIDDRGDVINLYKGLLGRDPGDQEIAIYKGKTWKETVYAFMSSDEFKARVANGGQINHDSALKYVQDNLK